MVSKIRNGTVGDRNLVECQWA